MNKRVIGLLVITLFMVIGSATVMTTLRTDSLAKISFDESDFNTFFSKIIDGEDMLSTISEDGDSFSYNSNGNNMIDYYVINRSMKYDAIYNVECDHDVLYTPENEVVSAGTVETGRISSDFEGIITCELNTIALERTDTNEGKVHYVILDADGGSLDIDRFYFVDGYAIGKLPVPKKTGYNFEGWYSSDNELGILIDETKIYTSDNNMKLFARYTVANSYGSLYNRIAGSVSDSSVVDFSKTSEENNTTGVYSLSEHTNGNEIIYYYRGNVDNNYVKFANYCWRILRTTEDGNIKMIYDGPLDGNGTCGLPNYTYVGKDNTYTQQTFDNTTQYYFGSSYEFSEETGFSLTGNIVQTAWSSSAYSSIANYYTCKYTKLDPCTNLVQVTGVKDATHAYANFYTASINRIIERNKYNSAANDNAYFGYMYGTTGSSTYASTHANTNNSNIKTIIDNWYQNHLTSYSSQIADVVYCNNRNMSDGTNSRGNTSTYGLLGYGTNYTAYGSNGTSGWWARNPYPDLVCKNTTGYVAENHDAFTVSSEIGNGKLTYPVATITSDELLMAGFTSYVGDESRYTKHPFLYAGVAYWSMTPTAYGLTSGSGSMYYVTYQARTHNNTIGSNAGIRPVIALKSSTNVLSTSDGTATNPYVLE